MTALAPATRRHPALGRAALLALALALLLAGSIALSPATADAQAGDLYGRWYAKVGGTAICPPDETATEAVAGEYSHASPTTITLRMLAFDLPNCSNSNVLTDSQSGEEGADYAGNWTMQLRTATGTGGSLISGAGITLPDTFSGQRTTGTHNSRDKASDGDWPNYRVPWGGPYMRTAQISFTVPASHTGPVYLYVSVFFNEQHDNNDVWEPFTFKFNPPPTPPASNACVGPIQRHVQRIGPPLNSRQVIQITDIHDCDGTARTTRTRSRVPVDRIPRDIPRPHADCSLIKSGITSDYQRDKDNSLHVAGQRGGRTAYSFQLRWADQGCGGGTPNPGTVIGVTTCGGGILSQTPIILQRRITADNRIAYQVDLRHQLSGQELDASCPYWFINLLWTYNVPATITAP